MSPPKWPSSLQPSAAFRPPWDASPRRCPETAYKVLGWVILTLTAIEIINTLIGAIADWQHIQAFWLGF